MRALASGALVQRKLAASHPASCRADKRRCPGSTLDLSVGFDSQVGDTFTILTAADEIIGTFQGLAEGAIITVNGMNFQISYQGAGGTAVVLTHVA